MRTATTAASGFHSGELDVQRRAGVTGEADRLAGMLAPARLDGGPANFLAQRGFAALTARDHDGLLWTSPLLGPPGFLAGHDTTLDIHATVADHDPLHGLPAGQPAGLIAIEFAIRRRLRVNGTLTATGPDGMTIDADQAYGNCPSYIGKRTLDRRPGTIPAQPAVRGRVLTAEHRELIAAADTVFLGTAHPARGADSSHKGGRPGFVRTGHDHLWWPDYAGNNMFNSLGNLAVNPEAALLFVDFATGRTLHLSGTAQLRWITPGSPGDDDGTGRRVEFRPAVIVSATLPIRAAEIAPAQHNPPLSA